MTEYVLGFMFDPDGEKVLLIEKTHPEWQMNQLNGIGGIIEKNESNLMAMYREFKEETGIDDFEIPWKLFCVMEVLGKIKVYCYKTFSDHIFEALQPTEEVPHLINIDELHQYSHVKNVKTLITIALDKNVESAYLHI